MLKKTLAQRYRRAGYLRALNLAIKQAEGELLFFRRMYEKRADGTDEKICLGRVFGAEQIIHSLRSLK